MTKVYPPDRSEAVAFDPTALIANAAALAETLRVPETFHSGKRLIVEHLWRTPHSSTAIAVIEPGGGLRPHFHQRHDEIIIFLDGEGHFRIGDEVRSVKARDVVVVPAGVVHTTLYAETRIVLAAVFSPGFDLDVEDRVYVD
ncbi:cupin domain-containing protein [Terricaulis sp.]|uniref:cupin domain-containing protein n=1 Tax=Terricaulis sp. TaxID=2768686 RepID=UPI0037850C1A